MLLQLKPMKKLINLQLMVATSTVSI